MSDPPDESGLALATVRCTVHDINNLLFAIAGQADLIIDGASDGSAEAAREILDAARTAAALCRRLLIDESCAVGIPLDIEAVACGNLRREQARGAARHELVIELTPEAAPTGCDALRLHQALANLVSNAQAAMGGGGRLTVQTTVEWLTIATIDTLGQALPPGRYWVLSVSDTGAGIAHKRFAQLFEPGYTTRAEPTTHGFGLSVVAEAARWHRGGVVVASAEGEGSRFAVWLPLGR